MKCPKCGCEMKDDQMYCMNCGTEIHFVPDFEPEIEDKIEESLSKMIQDFTEADRPTRERIEKITGISPEYSEDPSDLDKLEEIDINSSIFDDSLLDYSEEDLPNEDFWDVDEVINPKQNLFERVIKSRAVAILFVIAALAVVVGIVYIAVNVAVSTSHKNSYDYQLQMAHEAYDKGSYKSAVNYLEKAISINSSDPNVKFLLADYYCKAGLEENAVYVLKELILEKGETRLEAYDRLFSLYANMGKITEINDILSECEEEEILMKFQQYMAKKPEFNMPEGTYTENFYLKIDANTNGTIYYTMDGTMPDTSSEIYTAPIFLENGYYTINAFFVNSYGQISEIATVHYDVNSSVPATPVVTPESGEFTLPEFIVAQKAENYEYVLYYTTDGSEPNMESNVYEGPICMPLGKSTFSFVAISTTDEVASEIVTFEYELNLPGTIVSAPEAALAVSTYRYNLGDLVDMEGHLSTVEGRLVFQCDSAVSMNDNYFFVVTEYFENPENGMRNKSGRQYVVATNAPVVLGMLERDENGDYYVIGV